MVGSFPCEVGSFNHTFLQCETTPGEGAGLPVVVRDARFGVQSAGVGQANFSYAAPTVRALNVPVGGVPTDGGVVLVNGSNFGLTSRVLIGKLGESEVWVEATVLSRSAVHHSLVARAPPFFGWHHVALAILDVDGRAESMPTHLSYEEPSVSHVGALGPLGTDGGEIEVRGGGFGGGSAGWAWDVLVWDRLPGDDTAPAASEWNSCDDAVIDPEALFVKPGAEHRRFVAATGRGMGAMWLVVRVAAACSKPHAWSYDPPRVESVVEDGPRVLARREGNRSDVNS